MGDVKTHTKRYPTAALKGATGTRNGDWAVMTTTLDSGANIYAISHRRGGEVFTLCITYFTLHSSYTYHVIPPSQVHTYIASCGRSLQGRSQDHAEDFDEEGRPCGARRCPMVLNDFTLGQPQCDKHNRWRQRILAIEERILTKSWPARFATTGLGMMFVNTWNMFDYFILQRSGAMTFRTCMKLVACHGLRNNLDCGGPSAGPSPWSARAHQQTPEEAARRHVVVPISSVKGWTGARAPRCSYCNLSVTTCCLECSGPSVLVPLHKPEVCYGGVTTTFNCLELHLKNPSASRRCACSATKSAAAKRTHSKRKQGGGDEDDM